MTHLKDILSPLDKLAVKHGADILTHAQCRDLSLANAELLQQRGISHENIGILGENSLAYIIGLFSSLFAGNTNVPLSSRSIEAELCTEITCCDINWVICEGKYLDLARRLIERLHIGVLVFNSALRIEVLETPRTRRLRSNDSDVAFLLHTSGSTGSQKRVMLTHANILSTIESSVKSLELKAGETILVSLPISFVTGLTVQLLAGFALKASVVLFDQGIVTAKRILEIISRERITLYATVPTVLHLLQQYRHKTLYDTGHLRYLCVSGAPVSKRLLEDTQKNFPRTGIVHMYGLTECSPRVSLLLPSHAEAKRGSIGKPVPDVRVKIVDPLGRRVEPYQVGELLVQGRNVMRGYYRDEDATAKCIRNGWLHTGDLAFCDKEGFLYLKGRIKNIIISGGINIYPEEVEEALRKIPGIEDALVQRRAHPILGEVPIAYLVLSQPGSEGTCCDNVRSSLRQTLSAYKHPHEINIVTHLPISERGKIRRQ